jgi:hypothetical protein
VSVHCPCCDTTYDAFDDLEPIGEMDDSPLGILELRNCLATKEDGTVCGSTLARWIDRDLATKGSR